MERTPTQLLRTSGEALAKFVQAAPQSEIRLTPEAALVLSGEPLADLNFAFISGALRAEERLREYVQVLRSRDLPAIVILSERIADQLESVASELGLQAGGSVPLMVCNPVDVRSEPHTFQIKRVETETELLESHDVFARAFGLPIGSVARIKNPKLLSTPGTNTFILRHADEVMAIAQSTDEGTEVGIWSMGTSPEHRRKGAGRAMLNYLMDFHRARGAEHFYLLATESGKPLYEEVGFQTIAEPVVWVSGTSTQVPGL